MRRRKLRVDLASGDVVVFDLSEVATALYNFSANRTELVLKGREEIVRSPGRSAADTVAKAWGLRPTPVGIV